MPLTDAWLKAANSKPQDKVIEKSDRDGMSVRVSRKGKITFQLRYRYKGKPARIDLGTYPATSLKKARDEAARLKARLYDGEDPRIVKKLDRLKRVGEDSLSDLFYDWYEKYCKPNKVMHQEIKRSFEIHLLPIIGSIPARQTTVQHWLDILENVASIRPAIADRILTNGKQMLTWALRRDRVETNYLLPISAKVDLNVTKNRTKRILSDEEISLVGQAIACSRMTRKNKLFLALCLFYACRNGELRKAERSHFDFDAGTWTVPPENHKTGKQSGKPLIRPIPGEVQPYIEEAFLLSGGEYLFTNANDGRPMGSSAPLQLPYNIMQWVRKNLGTEMDHWTVHDLRRTARTNFSMLTQPHIAEIIVGHVLPGEWKTYDHHDYLAEQEKAYKAWFERLKEPIFDRL